MNAQIAERIRIIKQLKSTLNWKDQSLEKRIKWLKLWGFIHYGLTNLLLIYLIVMSSSVLLQIEPFVKNWHQSALMVMLTISLSLHAHFPIIEFLLLKHIKGLMNVDFGFDDRLNNELKGLVDDMNYRRFKPYWIIIPALLIFLSGILMFLELFPYWEMLPLPVLIVCVLLLWRLNRSVFQIRTNIENVQTRVVVNN